MASAIDSRRLKLPNKISFKLLPSFLFIIFLAIVPTLWFSSHVSKDLYYRQARSELEKISSIISTEVAKHLTDRPLKDLGGYVEGLSAETGQRLTIVNMKGTVIFDSSEDFHKMDNHAGRSEIHQALQGSATQSIRYSNTLKKEMLYFAEPLFQDGIKIAVLRTSIAVDEVSDVLAFLYLKVILFGFAIAVCCTLLSTVITRKIVLPLTRLQRGVKNFAEGNFDKQIAVASNDEFGAVVKSVNQMGQQLQNNMTEISNQNRESKAILSSMREGVLAVTEDLKIIRLNKSAANYLNVSDFKSGTQLGLVIRNQTIMEFVKKVLQQQQFISEDCVVYGVKEKLLHLKGTPLLNENDQVSGVVVIIHDVTHVRKLENMRQDFVANVSHELRTPIAILKSTVETLQDGAIEDEGVARRFLKILSKNTNRLGLLIEDILFLSKVEDKKSSIQFDEANLALLIGDSISSCEAKAKSKGIVIESNVDSELCWKLNDSLIIQALINLIQNGIKYSEVEKTIQVSATVQAGKLELSVADQGFGIDPEEFDRIFERFYRVDKSHSNKIEGTGLGLSIVKHIALVHNGSVKLTSNIQEGSTFTITLPGV